MIGIDGAVHHTKIYWLAGTEVGESGRDGNAQITRGIQPSGRLWFKLFLGSMLVPVSNWYFY